MKKGNGSVCILWALLLVPVFWTAAALAQVFAPGVKLDAITRELSKLLEHPLALQWTERTIKFLVIAVFLYGMGIAYYYAARGNTRPGEEHGSARWASAKQLCTKYQNAKHPENNLLFTQNIRMGMDTHKHRRNLNVLVIGGSGAGKTRFYCKPNIMQANCSFIVTDPKSEILRSVGGMLEAQGYEVVVFDLINMSVSDRYNPFRYIRSDEQAIQLITNLIKNTTPKNAKSDDPFWVSAETALLSALILYLYHEAPPEEQNFNTVMYMLENAEVREDDDDYKSPLDLLFESLEEDEPEHIAVKQYKVFRQGSGKTLKSILISAAVRLAPFNLPGVARITVADDMDLGSLGERKRALFCCIPDNDKSFNFLVGMLYTQAFQELYYTADRKHGGRLPVPVRIIADEFANVALPDEFESILSTMRSREISISIIIQNMAQLKALFEKSWESVVGNCDELLYLGGNEQATHEYISKMLGKATIDTKTRGLTKGRNGSSSENFQNAGRELLTLDEVRQMDRANALLFISGERPVMDKKFDLMKHPNIGLTVDGGAPPYERRPVPDYGLPDLPRPLDADSAEIIEPEEKEHEKPELPA